MTPSNGNFSRITGPLCGEFAGHWWIPRTKASDAELWCFLWSTTWINGWINNRETGDLRRHRAYYDVIIMKGFRHYWPFVREIIGRPADSLTPAHTPRPTNNQQCGALMVFFVAEWTSCWTNSPTAVNLKSHDADVTVVIYSTVILEY